MNALQSAAVAAALSTGAAALAGCGSSPGPAVSTASAHMPGHGGNPTSAQYGSPVRAALSWFSAINNKDKDTAAAHFEPAAAGQMNWGNGDTANWPTFSALHCRQTTRSPATASVYCTFTESQAPAAGNPDSFWNITLALQPDKQWLITSYGQG